MAQHDIDLEWALSQTREYLKTFDRADTDSSGFLSVQELKNVMEEQGCETDPETVAFMFKNLDVDGDNKITRQEFEKSIKELPKRVMRENLMRKTFRALDRDGSGFLTKDEATDGITNTRLVGMSIPTEFIMDIIMLAYKDADQKVHYEEFIRAFQKQDAGDALSQKFKALDKSGDGFLDRREIIDSMMMDPSLGMSGKRMGDFLDAIKEGEGKINYEDFMKIWNK